MLSVMARAGGGVSSSPLGQQEGERGKGRVGNKARKGGREEREPRIRCSL
jgi:hypothetical protein